MRVYEDHGLLLYFILVISISEFIQIINDQGSSKNTF